MDTPTSHPTLISPQSEEARFDRLRLLRSRRVGESTYYRLLRETGSARAALETLPEVAAEAGLANYAPCPPEMVERELTAARFAGATMLCHDDPAYPADLAGLADAPPILWAIGDLALLARPRLALIGARNASSLGLRMARKLAEDLGAEGQVIVSGLARGIDTAAHEAALATGTIAVMASGVDVIYPTENTVLGEEIGRKGLRLSEAPMGMAPQSRHFPRRNRIIAGLSRATIVIEAAAKSGSLITAQCALDQGREVLAVPGHPFDARAAGCNMLIRDGATLVRGARDILDQIKTAEPMPAQPELELRTPDPDPPRRPDHETRALHQKILDRLGPSPQAEDALLRDIAAPAREAAEALVELELQGAIARDPGGFLTRC